MLLVVVVVVTEGADLSLRLVDGTSKCSGRLEVRFQEEWGTVCDDSWDGQDASVVCKQLGCPAAIAGVGRVNASEGSGPIWLDSVSCNGDEPALWECKHQEWGKHYCHHREDAGVTCSGELKRKPNPGGKNLRSRERGRSGSFESWT